MGKVMARITFPMQPQKVQVLPLHSQNQLPHQPSSPCATFPVFLRLRQRKRFNMMFLNFLKNKSTWLTHALTPTSMFLDLGCTRAMTSWRAAKDLMEFCDQNPDCGLWCRLDQTTSQFTFASSESASCKQKIVVCMYDVDYYVQSTEFDIVEQGEVPTLMSLPQMRNLRFQFDSHPDKAYLSSPDVRHQEHDPQGGQKYSSHPRPVGCVLVHVECEV